MAVEKIKAFQVDTNEITDVTTFNSRVPWNISALTYSATITPDLATSRNFTVTLTGNTTIANPTNITPGQSGVIYLVQDGVGSHVAAFGDYWDFEDGAAPTLSTAANAVDVLIYEVRSATSIVSTLLKRVGG